MNALMNIDHRFTTPYNPNTAGLVERCNQQLIQLIRCYVDNIVNEWDTVLPYITHVYNTSFHSATKYSPFYLVRGFEPKHAIDYLIDNNDFDEKSEFVDELKTNIQVARNLAKDNISNAQEKYKEYFDQNKCVHNFREGDKCLIKYSSLMPTIGKKFSTQYIGPFYIVHKINDLTYEIESQDGQYYFDRIHVNKLRPYNERELFVNIDKNFVQSEPNISSRPIRSKRTPVYLKDYYTGN
ncbi:uncharacterized protein B4U80_13414 [Leptotrombidium deliense]|uniref:Integrase catalytic domain-containing protein n=1 Tax=Leptotrombidium deliense TaxID=299467 RepID=A0A443S6U6_9ACAR|nr:uncharacterized protein B4U80_13414 [Leptotrombidium deliense]